MVIGKIKYSTNFLKRLQYLDVRFQKAAFKAETLFRENPLHPSLRLHQLHGKFEGTWSISVTMDIRIIFERMENGDILFASIGRHDIYRSL